MTTHLQAGYLIIIHENISICKHSTNRPYLKAVNTFKLFFLSTFYVPDQLFRTTIILLLTVYGFSKIYCIIVDIF